MTGTDLPTVVRNPKVKVKVKTAPQQTTRYARGSLRPEKLQQSHLHRHRSGIWHVPKYMDSPDILPLFGTRRYDEDVENDPDELLTSHEVAKIFRVNERTVRRWHATGQLDDCAFYTPGGKLRYRADRIRVRVRPQTSPPGSPTPPQPGGDSNPHQEG